MSAAISVIIPSALKTLPGSEELWIERAIRSVLDQTLEPAEILIGLDPGEYLRPELFRHGRPMPPTYLANGETKGHQAACNAAVTKAQYPLIAFLEDDDTWEPNHLETLVGAMNDYGADLVTGSQLEGNASGPLGVFDFPTCSSWLVRRQTWQEIGGFDTRFRVHHDNVFLGEIHRRGKRRLHIVEDGTDIDRPGPNRIPWLRQIARYCPVASIEGLKRPTVNRFKHEDSVLGQARQGGEKAQRAAREYAALTVLYDGIPW